MDEGKISELSLDKLNAAVRARVAPFAEELLTLYKELVVSISVVGSSVTPDFDPKRSDTNLLVLLKEMDVNVLDFLASVGKKYGRKGLRAPLLMTEAYISDSLDVFPIEFMDLQLIHETVYGEDFLKELAIKKTDLRLQVERELRAKLVQLRQGYIAAAEDKRALARLFTEDLSSYFPVFRALLHLTYGGITPVPKKDVLEKLQEVTGIDMAPFKKLFAAKKGEEKLDPRVMPYFFRQIYTCVEKLMERSNDIEI